MKLTNKAKTYIALTDVFNDFVHPDKWRKEHKNQHVTTRGLFLSMCHNQEKFIVTIGENIIEIPAKGYTGDENASS